MHCGFATTACDDSQGRHARCSRELSELEQQLAAEQASQRAEALETLIDLQGPDASQAVMQSLGDRDDDLLSVNDCLLFFQLRSHFWYQTNSCNSALASCESFVSNPSVNQP